MIETLIWWLAGGNGPQLACHHVKASARTLGIAKRKSSLGDAERPFEDSRLTGYTARASMNINVNVRVQPTILRQLGVQHRERTARRRENGT